MENRTTDSKNTTENKRSATNSTQNNTEHKHPNQYTKGADDEGAKNCGKNAVQSTNRSCH